MSKQRYEGRTAAEAAIRACEALGLTRGELRHTVISDEGEMLSRRVVIEVEVPKARAAAPTPPAPRQEPRQESRREPREPREVREPSRPAPARVAEAPAVVLSEAAEAGDGARSERPSRARRPRAERRPRNADAQPANAEAQPEGDAAPAAERAASTPRRPRADRPRPSASVAPDDSAEVSSVVGDASDAGEASAAAGERGRGRSRTRGRGGRSRNERPDRPEGAGRSAEAVPAPSVVPRDDDSSPAPPPYAAAPTPAYVEDRAPAAAAAAAPVPAPARNGGRRGPRGNDAARSSQGGVDSLLAMRPADDFADLEVKKLPAIAPVSERSKRVCGMVAELVELMGFDLESRLVSENEAEVHVHLHGPSEQDAVGDKGEVLLSLQFAINRMLSRHEDEGEQVLVLDAGGYRQRRQLAIEKLARDLAERALAHSKAVRLSPMSAHDRRIFHLALKDFAGITTQSEGDGVFRNLLIVPSAFL